MNATYGTSVGFIESLYTQNESLYWTLMSIGFVGSLLGQAFVFNQESPSVWNSRKPRTISEKGKVWREIDGCEVAVENESPIIAKKRQDGEARKFKWDEVRKHDKKDDLWLVIDGCVYDVTPFVERHPGGYRSLVHMAGRDATDVMAEYHPANVFESLLPKFYIGDVVDYKVPELIADYRAVRQGLLSRGLFQTSWTYYAAKFIWLFCIFVPTICGVIFCKSTLVHMISAVGLALFWQQLAFVGHDVGHSSVSHKRVKDYYWGSLFGNILGGISLFWWKLSHNTHHVTCNSVEHDPDIQHLPIFAITEKIFGRFYSTYHNRYFETDMVARFLVSYQHILFYPVMGLARFNLYLQGWLVLLAGVEDVPFRQMQIATMLVFPAWLGYFLSYLPNWQERVAYLLISHFFAGILHVQITISHFSMDTFHGCATDDWIRHQMRTTMDVDCPLWMDWFHGGLQFQLEHHLFPRLPRHNLRAAREQVLILAKKHNLEYIDDTFVNANRRTLKAMYETALKARKLKKGDAGFYVSPMWEALNANG